MQKIAKIEVTFADVSRYALTQDGIAPGYTGSVHPVAALDTVIAIWRQHFATNPPLTLPTPETVNVADKPLHLQNIHNFSAMLTNDYDSCSTLVLSGLLFDVASLLAIEERLAADHG